MQTLVCSGTAQAVLNESDRGFLDAVRGEMECLGSIALSGSFNHLSDSFRIRNSTDPATLKSDVGRMRDDW